jgi:phosphoenolpyruvate-protein phosphotransferase
MERLSGISASRGIAVGVAYWLEEEPPHEHQTPTPGCPAEEWRRFDAAVQSAQADLREVQAETERLLGAEQAAIFQAQRLMLDDPELQSDIREAIHTRCLSATAAVEEAFGAYRECLLGLEDEYFRARAADVEDVQKRLMRALLGWSDLSYEPPHPAVVVAADLTPSDTLALRKENVLGFCLARGGATSHVAILARSLGLPAVVGLGHELLSVRTGETVIVDGTCGELILRPEPGLLDEYQSRRSLLTATLAEARRRSCEPAVTRDGHAVVVVANIGGVDDARSAVEAGAEGVGLLRTEFLFLERDAMPSEAEQRQAYRAVLELFGERPVTLRTLDVGGDKEVPYLPLVEEGNPFLGCRAIRLALDCPELLMLQIRAALTAGCGSRLRVMFPMVSTLSEVRRALAVVRECESELAQEGAPHAESVQVGIMVEVPAAALMADQLAREVDFFSIGTNDLTQYTLAADRTNPAVNHLCDAFHPAVLRLVRDVAEAAREHSTTVAVCGELASEPLAIPILLGLGIDELSMNPPTIPLAKHIIRSINLADARVVARSVLDAEGPDEVRAAVAARFPTILPG